MWASVHDLFSYSRHFEPEEQLTIKCQHLPFLVIISGVCPESHCSSLRRGLSIIVRHFSAVIWCYLSSKCIVLNCTNKQSQENFQSTKLNMFGFTHWVKYLGGNFHSDCVGIYAEPLSHIYLPLRHRAIIKLLCPSVHQRSFLDVGLYSVLELLELLLLLFCWFSWKKKDDSYFAKLIHSLSKEHPNLINSRCLTVNQILFVSLVSNRKIGRKISRTYKLQDVSTVTSLISGHFGKNVESPFGKPWNDHRSAC